MPYPRIKVNQLERPTDSRQAQTPPKHHIPRAKAQQRAAAIGTSKPNSWRKNAAKTAATPNASKQTYSKKLKNNCVKSTALSKLPPAYPSATPGYTNTSAPTKKQTAHYTPTADAKKYAAKNTAQVSTGADTFPIDAA